jgi:hypothetical protein
LQEVLAHADELAERFEAYEPDDETPVMSGPEWHLRRAARARALAERELAAAVAEAREGGVAWRVIGETLGTSAQSAQKRYGRLVVSSTVKRETTPREGRDPAPKRKSGGRAVATRAAKPVKRVAVPAKRVAIVPPARSRLKTRRRPTPSSPPE